MGDFNRTLQLAAAGLLGLALLAPAGGARAQNWGDWETWSGRYIGPHKEWRCNDYGECWQVTVRGHDRYAGLNVDGTPRHHHRRRARTHYGQGYAGAYGSPYGYGGQGYQDGGYSYGGYSYGYQGQGYQGQGYQGQGYQGQGYQGQGYQGGGYQGQGYQNGGYQPDDRGYGQRPN
jgi:hypothetical protein